MRRYLLIAVIANLIGMRAAAAEDAPAENPVDAVEKSAPVKKKPSKRSKSVAPAPKPDVMVLTNDDLPKRVRHYPATVTGESSPGSAAAGNVTPPPMITPPAPPVPGGTP